MEACSRAVKRVGLGTRLPGTVSQIKSVMIICLLCPDSSGSTSPGWTECMEPPISARTYMWRQRHGILRPGTILSFKCFSHELICLCQHSGSGSLCVEVWWTPHYILNFNKLYTHEWHLRSCMVTLDSLLGMGFGFVLDTMVSQHQPASHSPPY